MATIASGHYEIIHIPSSISMGCKIQTWSVHKALIYSTNRYSQAEDIEFYTAKTGLHISRALFYRRIYKERKKTCCNDLGDIQEFSSLEHFNKLVNLELEAIVVHSINKKKSLFATIGIFLAHNFHSNFCFWIYDKHFLPSKFYTANQFISTLTRAIKNEQFALVCSKIANRPNASSAVSLYHSLNIEDVEWAHQFHLQCDHASNHVLARRRRVYISVSWHRSYL